MISSDIRKNAQKILKIEKIIDNLLMLLNSGYVSNTEHRDLIYYMNKHKKSLILKYKILRLSIKISYWIKLQ